MNSVRSQAEAGDVDGPTAAEEAPSTDWDNSRMTACSCDDGQQQQQQPADITTAAASPKNSAGVEHGKSAAERHQTRRDDKLIHQMALIDTADQSLIYGSAADSRHVMQPIFIYSMSMNVTP